MQVLDHLRRANRTPKAEKERDDTYEDYASHTSTQVHFVYVQK